MTTVQEFIDANRHLAYLFEGKMALAYCSAMKDLESAKDENHSLHEAARKKLAIRSDIEDFMEIVGGYSRRNIAEKLHRSIRY